MITYIYIKNARKYVELSEEFPSDSPVIGETWEDYLSGKYVKLNDELIKFKESNPRASVLEVFFTELDINRIKREKIEYIDSFLTGGFYLNDVEYYLDSEERRMLLYRAQCELEESTVWWFNYTKYIVPILTALSILKLLESYASTFFDLKKQSSIEVLSLPTILEVIDYQFVLPEKLRFYVALEN